MTGLYTAYLPTAATNVATNPSLETGSTGWSASVGATFTRVVTKSRYGIYSAEFVDIDNAGAYGEYQQTTSSTGTYTVSAYARASGATPSIVMTVLDNGVSRGTSTVALTSARWTRVSLAGITLTATKDVEVRFSNSSGTSITIYVDALQIESGSTMTSYLDGDMGDGYAWSGTYHASTSTRAATVRSAGTEFNFDSIYMHNLSWSGFGVAPLAHVSQPQAFRPGEYYQGKRFGTRLGILDSEIDGTSQTTYHERLEAITGFFVGSEIYGTQPFHMRYTGGNATLSLYARYNTGLESPEQAGFVGKVALSLRSDDPYWYLDSQDCVSLTTLQTLTSEYLLYRTAAGAWNAVTGGSPNGAVYVVYVDPKTGTIYAGGNFTSIGGTAAARIAYSTDGGATWNAMSSGANGIVRAIVVGTSGTVYAGGDFTTIGASTGDYIGKWNGSAWSRVGTVDTALDGAVWALDINPITGYIIVGGAFTAADAVANTGRIAQWNGSAWVALADGFGNGIVYAIEHDHNGNIYAGGTFTQNGTGTTIYRIAKATINSTKALASAWADVVALGLNDAVRVIKRAPDGSLWIGGDFITNQGGTVNYSDRLIRYNGSGFVNVPGNGADNSIYALLPMVNNSVVVGGLLQSCTIAGTQSLALHTGALWAHYEAEGSNTGTVYTIAQHANTGSIWVGYSTANDMYTTATATATNIGSADAYPKITFLNGATASIIKWIENLTTGQRIYLDLDVLPNETVVFNFDFWRYSDAEKAAKSIITSNVGRTPMQAVLGELPILKLAKGANIIAVRATVAPTACVMTWTPAYLSQDMSA